MRPLFKVPGKAALDASCDSFVSSSSLGVLITNRLWKNNVYTEKEMVAIMTGFSGSQHWIRRAGDRDCRMRKRFRKDIFYQLHHGIPR